MPDAAVLDEESMPDIGPGMEWYRELADEDAAPRAAGAP
jgi:hypothetical protein